LIANRAGELTFFRASGAGHISLISLCASILPTMCGSVQRIYTSRCVGCVFGIRFKFDVHMLSRLKAYIIAVFAD